MLDLPDRNTRSGALHQAILHVLLFLGLRKGELIGLKVGDWDTERGTPVLRFRQPWECLLRATWLAARNT